MGEYLDEHDQAFYAEAFILADAVYRFLNRISTQRVLDAGLLSDDVVRDLVESADRMWLIRTQRVGAAREEPPTAEAWEDSKLYRPADDAREYSKLFEETDE